jgi:hypothetical protein
MKRKTKRQNTRRLKRWLIITREGPADNHQGRTRPAGSGKHDTRRGGDQQGKANVTKGSFGGGGGGEGAGDMLKPGECVIKTNFD